MSSSRPGTTVSSALSPSTSDQSLTSRSLSRSAARSRNLAGAALAWFLAIVAGVTGYWVLKPVIADPLDSDFTLVFIAARIGLEHGWDHVYSIALQHQLFAELRPGVFFNDGQRYLAPPPLAWITAPLEPLGGPVAFYTWAAISIAALAGAWWIAAPGRGAWRWVWLLGVFAWYPVLYALSYGQPAPLVLLAVAACWRLSEARRPVLAGAVLALGMTLKPQLVLAVPVVLLAAARWRPAVAWAVTIATIAAVSLATLGASGLADYRSLLAEAQALPNNRYFTFAYVVGPGVAGYLVQGAVFAVAAVAAYVNRSASTGRLIALGVVASALGATYWHLQDYTILLAAAWLSWRDPAPAWWRAWPVAVAVAAELAWPLKPLPLLIAMAVWFVILCVPRSGAHRQASPATA